MYSMHKLHPAKVATATSAQQQRKTSAWLRVAASLSEQIVAELRAVTTLRRGANTADLQRAMALAMRLDANNRAMHDTLGTLFDKVAESADDGPEHKESISMNESITTLEKDMASLKLDVAVMRSNYASKSDVSEAKSAVILSCVGTMIALSGVAFAVAKLVH